MIEKNNLLYNYIENLDISPKNILENEFNREWKIEEIKKFEEKWENLIKMVENREALFEEISELKNEKEKIFSKISSQK